VCHAEFDLPAKVTPEKPIFVLPDFVVFSHARHKTACATCHGEKPLAMKMKACVDCHKTNKATVACTACHDLSQ
jgi:Class III cytochrome C family